MSSSTPRASLHSVGCRLNQAETAILANRLKAEGYQLVEFGHPTDLLVLNTCSVTEQAETECRHQVRQTLKHSPDAFVAVTGCYAQTGADVLQQIPGIDLILGTQYKMDLPQYLPPPSSLRKTASAQVLHTKTMTHDDFTMAGVGEYDTTRAQLKIQDGCDFMCSFCLIPFARGHERSRLREDILREAQALAERGHQELVLTGVNIGRFRAEHDPQGRDFLSLLEALEAIPGIERIRISSIEPTTIPDALLEYMASSSKLCHFLHVPLQSGDDDVLSAMNRRYTVTEYRTFIEKAVAMIPDLGLGTDVMVGFPSESDQAFANTLAVAGDLPFSYLHVFSYSRRPRTAAARMKGLVPGRVIKSRREVLAELSRAKRLTFYQRYVGQTVTALFEGHEEGGRWTGLTANFLRVAVSSPTPLRNHLRRVQITGIMDGLAVGSLKEDCS
jgi:threonylcarbamoyladenosine tRNA methylthiotransferase MtaB